MSDKTKVSLEWYFYVMLGVVAVAALSMTWWSMYDLGTTNLSAPVFIAAVASSIFDIGGLFLGGLSIKYAKTDDSGFGTELATFAFIATSTYIVIQHAILADYPAAGIVMFAAAPIVLGIIFKATLQYLTRQQRREAGRVTDRLPSVGWLTWLRYGPQAFKLASVAMQGRIINAADKLNIAQDKHGIFVQPVVVSATVEKTPQTIAETPETTIQGQLETDDNSSQQLSQGPVRQELTSGDKPVLPVWLPNEPDMKPATLVRTCVDNNVFDIETIYRYAVQIKGQDVNKNTLRTELRRKLKTI